MLPGKGLRNFAAVIGASLCFAPAGLSAQQSVVQPQGPFAQIDTRLANETIELLEKGNDEEQQRTIERIKDVTARQAVRELNRSFGQEINQYAFQDLPKLEALIPRVVEWDRRTPHRLKKRWLE